MKSGWSQKQKDQLRALQEGRRRAEKVLAARRDEERKKRAAQRKQEAEQQEMKRRARELMDLAEKSGLLALAEGACLARGGALKKEVRFYYDYGLNTSHLHRALLEPELREMRVSHLALRITWLEAGQPCAAEARVHRWGYITFHNSPLPIFPLLWRIRPGLLRGMLENALCHPTHPQAE